MREQPMSMAATEDVRALSDIDHLRQVVRRLRGLLRAAADAERRAAAADGMDDSAGQQ